MEEQGSSVHKSVMLRQVIEMLDLPGKKVLLDCTTGLGGHSIEMLKNASPDAKLIAVDLDESNLRLAKERLADFAKKARFFQANFADVIDVLQEAGVDKVDALVADLGVASTQIDTPQRGLSFMAEGPLDMRMDQNQQITAANLVNTLGQEELADLIYEYGEERYSRRIARAIVAARQDHAIETTQELTQLIISAYPGAAKMTRKGVHPATRTFQALRIAVNRELENLQRLLKILPEILAVGGRAAIISFHSLEDRLVKHAFADLVAAGKGRLLTKKPLTPDEIEINENPRSRSAKLRGIEIIN